jgi:hypothetical protein
MAAVEGNSNIGKSTPSTGNVEKPISKQEMRKSILKTGLAGKKVVPQLPKTEQKESEIYSKLAKNLRRETQEGTSSKVRFKAPPEIIFILPKEEMLESADKSEDSLQSEVSEQKSLLDQAVEKLGYKLHPFTQAEAEEQFNSIEAEVGEMKTIIAASTLTEDKKKQFLEKKLKGELATVHKGLLFYVGEKEEEPVLMQCKKEGDTFKHIEVTEENYHDIIP